MIQWTNVNSEDPTVYLSDPIVLVGNLNYMFVFCLTGRSGLAGPLPTDLAWDLDPVRTKSEVYFRGVREKLEVTANTGASWRYRRIVVETSNPDWRVLSPEFNVISAPSSVLAGHRRTVNQPVDRTNYLLDLFRGTEGEDWNSVFVAPLDPKEVKVHSQMTRQFSSGNNFGKGFNLKFWHGMNKTISYDDNFDGARTTPSPFSTQSGNTMKDVYCIEFWQCVTGSASDTMTVNYETSMYWHER